MKRALEGRGFVTRTMYSSPVIEFEGCFTFITSNGLPAISKDPDSKHDWDAIKVRTALVETDLSFTDKGKAAFPFNATQLAHYFLHLVDKYADSNPPDIIRKFELEQPVMLGKRKTMATPRLEHGKDHKSMRRCM